MVRPRSRRKIHEYPDSTSFAPLDPSRASGREVTLAVDELEALRLGDLEGLHQARAAELMGVSRQTFGRIIETARRKVADALVSGHTLKVGGGAIEISGTGILLCVQCGAIFMDYYDSHKMIYCEDCGANSLKIIPLPRSLQNAVILSSTWRLRLVIAWWQWWCLPFAVIVPYSTKDAHEPPWH
ncbi:MAG: DUF134 domain-containing protein [Candidatus Eremiobacteraeota bacterium]|nr:DUF134 domain-containing protein [Candidatus Eremiobacteraeota bacterium]